MTKAEYEKESAAILRQIDYIGKEMWNVANNKYEQARLERNMNSATLRLEALHEQYEAQELE